MPKRTYTPAERTAALDALARNGGAVRLTARQVGVPYSTLWEWASEREHPGGEAHASGPSGPTLPTALRSAALSLFDQIPASAESAPLRDVVAAIETLVGLADKLGGGSRSPSGSGRRPFDPHYHDEHKQQVQDAREKLIELVERYSPHVGETVEDHYERMGEALPPQAKPGMRWDGWTWTTDPIPAADDEPHPTATEHTPSAGGAYG